MAEQIADKNKEQIEIRTVSMYSSDWRIIEAYANRFDLGTSATLRMIVRQWAATRQEQVSELPTPV